MFLLDLHQTKKEINIFEKIVSFMLGVCLICCPFFPIDLIIVKVLPFSGVVMDPNLAEIFDWYENFSIVGMVDKRASKKQK